MTERATAPRRTIRRWLATRLRMRKKKSWAYGTSPNGLRRRVYCLLSDNHPWWDWGHHLMTLVGRDYGGNWSQPEPPTWWYRLGPPKLMWRTRYPTHPLSTIQVVKSYDEFRSLTKGFNEDQMYPWKAIGVNQDGEQLHLGHQYWGGTFYGLTHWEVPLLRRYLRMWRRLDWFGLRSLLYSQALHAAVYRKRPGSCGATPPKGQGGYDHWRCELRRRHEGMHRVVNYVWGEIDGEAIGAHYLPVRGGRRSPFLPNAPLGPLDEHLGVPISVTDELGTVECRSTW